MDQGARFPRVAAKAGHYESFYVKACRPGGGQGVWIRHTVHKRPGAEPNASIWFVLFDREAEGPRATKATVPAGELSVPADGWIRVADAEIGPGRARGAVGGENLTAAWDLSVLRRRRALQVPALRPALRDPPAEDQVRRPLPRRPLRRAAGNRRREDRARRLAGDDRPQLGDRARRALGLARGQRLRRLARHLLRRRRGADQARPLDDPLGPLGDADARRRAAPARRLRPYPRRDGSRSRPASAASSCPARTSSSAAASRRRRKDFVGWVYADPDGPEHNTINCSVADLELTVERPSLPALRLDLPAGGAYELGMRETDHGIPIQPFPDG